jgi:hypothetical protein
MEIEKGMTTIEDWLKAVAGVFAPITAALLQTGARRPAILPITVCQSLISPTRITW